MALTPHDLVLEAKALIREIDVATGAQEIAKNTLIIDIREPFEFEAGRLTNAINIPRGLLEFKTLDHPALKENQNTKIMLYCRSGGRSALAAHTLLRLGYTNVLSLEGGVENWIKQGQAMVTDTTSYAG